MFLGNEKVVEEAGANESDEDLPLGPIAELQFYDGDQRLPVYKRGLTRGMNTDEAAEMILKPFADRTRIATRVPTSISKNTVFVVDTSNLLNEADVKCDDLGAWLCTGSHKFLYSTDETGICHKLEEQSDCPPNHVLYIVQRQFFSNKSLPSLRKSIINARQATSTSHQDLEVIQYIFTEGEQEVIVKSHGNSKRTGSRAFKRTMQSTRDFVREKLKELPPRKVIHSIVDERGGIMKVESAGEFPRNRAQVYNANRHVKRQEAGVPFSTGDPLLQVLTKAKEEQQGLMEDVFIREIPLFPEPIVFLATEQQLADIVRFCTNPEAFCILGVDCTFQIADFYYTFTTYRNLMLTTDKGVHPVCIGPGILHKQKLLTSYKTLPLLMTKYNKETSGVLAYGTDGEENLYKAMSQVFEDAKHLRCDIHLRDNVKRKLNELGITGSVASEIVCDIFGKVLDGVTEGGLVDCTSSEELDMALNNVTSKWPKLHQNGDKFTSYFVKEKAEVIRESATADIRSMCGLGFPPKVYTQNASECMNRLVKAEEDSKFAKKADGLLPSIERIRAEVKRQNEEQFLAVIGRGEYRLTNDFSFLGVEEKNFFRMSEQQKNSLKKKFISASMSHPLRHRVTKEEEIATKNVLSITAENAHIIDIPFPLLKGMFSKAATTVNDQTAVWKVPSSEGSDPSAPVRVMVHSRSSRDPRTVLISPKTGRVQCDKGCANWATYSMCSHTLAAAEKTGILKEFLNWFKSKKRSPNLSAIANVNMPKNAGQKVGTRKRKGGSNKPSTERGHIVRSRVLQPSFMPSTNSIPSSHAVPGTSDENKEGRPLDCDRVLLLAVTPAPSAKSSCSPAPGTYVSDHTTSWPRLSPCSQTHPSHGFIVPEAPHLTYNYPATQQVNENTPPTYPQRPKPAPGILVFARLAFLDSKVTRCYGCGNTLKPGGTTPHPPDDLVLTTRLRRQYYKEGQLHTSPDISSVYYHVNLYCIRVTFPSFHPNLCQIPSDLQQFLLPEHKQMIVERLAAIF